MCQEFVPLSPFVCGGVGASELTSNAQSTVPVISGCCGGEEGGGRLLLKIRTVLNTHPHYTHITDIDWAFSATFEGA